MTLLTGSNPKHGRIFRNIIGFKGLSRIRDKFHSLWTTTPDPIRRSKVAEFVSPTSQTIALQSVQSAKDIDKSTELEEIIEAESEQIEDSNVSQL